MTEALPLNSIEPLDLDIEQPVSKAQEIREYELQGRAGVEVSNNFEGVRTQVAATQEEAELNDLYSASESALNRGASADLVSNYIRGYRPSILSSDLDSALEAAAAEKELEEAYANNPQTLSNALNNVFTQDEKDSLTKSEMFETFLQSLDAYANDFSGWHKFGTGASRMLMPIVGTQSLDQDVISEGKDIPLELSSVTTTKRQQAVFDEAAKTMSVTDFQNFLNAKYNSITNGSVDASTIKDFVIRMREDANSTNDIFGMFEIFTPILRSVNNAARAAKAAGNTEKAKNIIIKDRAQFLQEAAGPSAIKPFQASNTITYHNKVSSEIADTLADAEANKIIEKFEVKGVMTEEEINTYKELEKARIKNRIEKAGGDPLDVVVDVVEGESGEIQTALVFGTGIKGDAAMSQAAAYNYGKRLGFADGDFDIFQGDGEGWYVRTIQPLFDHNMTVVGDSKGLDDWTIQFHSRWLKPLEGPLNWIQRNFAGSTGLSREAHARDVQAIRKMTAARNKMHDVYGKLYHDLSKPERKSLKAIYVKGQHENNNIGKWFTPDELDEMGATEAMKKAYYAFKKTSDIDYISRNDALVRRLNREGYKLALVNGEELIAKEVDMAHLTKNFNNMIINVDGKNMSTINTTAEALVKEYGDKGYKLVQVNKRSNLYKDLNYTHMLVKDGNIQMRHLPRFITNYAPGGRRAYTYGTMFVKIGRTLMADGKLMNGYARTLMAGLDRTRLEKYVQECNEAIDIAKRVLDEGVSPAAADKLITDKGWTEFKADNWEQLKALIRTEDNPQGLIDRNYKAKLLEDGENLIYDNNLPSVVDDVHDVDSALQDLIDMRSEYTRHRGQILDSVNGDKASILSLDEIFDKSINKASYGLALSDLHEWYGREFRRNFMKAIDRKVTPDADAMSNQDLLRHAKILDSGEVDEATRPLVRAAENFQRKYLRITNAKTEWDKRLDKVMKRTAQALDAYVPGIERGGKVFETIAKADPVKAARALGFHAAMTFYNPAQLIKQGLGILNTVALEPVDGARAMLAYPLFRIARMFNNHKIVNNIADAAVKLVGISHEDFKGILKYMDEYGSWESSRMLVGLDSNHAAVLNRSKILKSTSWFMKEGTDANYVISDIAAYLAKKNEGFKAIAEYSDDLFTNMTRASESAFQAGQKLPTAVLAQWLGYPTRMIEALANKRLTAFQRGRLLAAQIAAWGVGGTFLDDENSLNFYKNLREEYNVGEYWAGVITNGLITQEAAEYGVEVKEGLSLLELAKKELMIWNLAKGKFEMPSIPVAQFGQQVAALYSAVQEALAPTCGEYDIYNYMKTLATTKGLPSGPRNLAKALVAWHTREFYNTHQDHIKQNVKDYQVWAQAFGFGPTEMSEQQYLYEALANEQETVKELVDEVKPLMDAIINYQESVGIEDPAKRAEEFSRISARQIEMVRAHIAMLKDSFPEGRAAEDYQRQIGAYWEKHLSVEEKRQEVYEQAGGNWLRYIQEIMRRQ